MSPKVDDFLRQEDKWRPEMTLLRKLPLACGLTEDFKWGHPCYAFEGRNVVLIHGFKEYCALLFFKGVLLKDRRKILIQQTENVQAARQIRFTNVDEITGREAILKAYIREAIELEKAGAEVAYKQTSDFKVPEEFQERLDRNPTVKRAFESLTPGRQRAYLFHFSGAKLAETREARIAKCLPKILQGKGLDD